MKTWQKLLKSDAPQPDLLLSSLTTYCIKYKITEKHNAKKINYHYKICNVWCTLHGAINFCINDISYILITTRTVKICYKKQSALLKSQLL